MAQQETQKAASKGAVPKPGPAPKGIPQPSVLGKAPKEEVSADATIKDYQAHHEEPRPKTPIATPTATAAAPVQSELSESEQRLAKDIEARLSREIEARLRRELEPRIAKEIELKLLRQFDNQLQKVVNESVEKAIQRHSQPNLQAVSRDEINAFKAGNPVTKSPTPTPMSFKAVGASETKPERILTPGNIPIAKHPSQPTLQPIKLPTPASLAIAGPASNPNMQKIATPPSLAISKPSSDPSMKKAATPVSLAVAPSSSPAQALAPVVIPEPEPEPAAPKKIDAQDINVWSQDPSLQKSKQTQQIRVSKVRVSLDDVAPERLIGPSAEDLGQDFLKDAGVSRGGRIAMILFLIAMLIGGSGFGAYYVYSRQTPNPPRTEPVHAAIAGVELGTVRFAAGGPEVDVIFQPPTMLLGQGKIKKAPPAYSAPKPSAAPAPKATTPPVTPPKSTAPKLKTIERPSN
jgi:hypothetical protein